jgi:type IV pilus assembly protein PilN
MRLDINLATHPYEDVGSFRLRWGGVLAGLGLLTLLLVYSAVAGWATARKDRDLIRQSQAQIAARDQEKANAEAILNRPENQNTRDRSQFLNQLFQRKAFAWTKVFEDLEGVMPPHLHVVSIRPEMASDNQLQIKLVVAGESRDRAQELVRRMEDSQRFQQTEILQETTATSGQAVGDRVQFDISALYVPETESTARRGTP